MKLPRLWMAVAALAFSAVGANGAELTAEKKAEAEAFAANNAVSALYHEFGHLFVDQFELPVLGSEEDVADAIATLMVMSEKSDAAVQVSLDTVDGYFMSSQIFEEDQSDDFGDGHGLDVQRAYQMTCLLVGGDPDHFTDLATEAGFDLERQERLCVEEFKSASRSWKQLTDGHRRLKPEGGAEIKVIYDDAGKEYAPIAELLKREQVLEGVAAAINADFVLVRPATLRGTLCDEENAYYDEVIDEVSICYEYVQFFYDLFADPENAGMDSAANKGAASSAEADVAAGPVIEGDDQVEGNSPQDRQQHTINR